jgi:hypothetical protein
MASKLGSAGLNNWRGWDLTSPRLGTQKGPDAVGISRAFSAGRTVKDGTPEGISETGLLIASTQRHYFLPVEAWYTMRMQSNPYRKWAR